MFSAEFTDSMAWYRIFLLYQLFYQIYGNNLKCHTIFWISRNSFQTSFHLVLQHLKKLFLSSGTTGEGWYDPVKLLTRLKLKNQQLGVQYITGKATGFRHTLLKTESENGIEDKKRIEDLDVNSLNLYSTFSW